MIKPKETVLAQREGKLANDLARKRDIPNLSIDPVDDLLEDGEVQPNAKISLY